jgi:hypothetical protein
MFVVLQQDSQTDTLNTRVLDTLATGTTDSSGNSKTFQSAEIFLPAEAEDSILPNFFYSAYTEGMPIKTRTAIAESWINPLLLLLFFFASILFSYYTKEIKVLILSPFRKDGIRKINSEENFMVRRTLLALMLIFLLSLPVLIYQTLKFSEIDAHLLDQLPMYLQLAGICAGLIGLRLLTIGLVGRLFLCKREAGIYKHGIMLMFSGAGLTLIPICLTVQFISGKAMAWLIIAGWLVVGISYLTGLIAGSAAALRSHSISKFHLILYFCSLELLPAILILKVVGSLA